MTALAVLVLLVLGSLFFLAAGLVHQSYNQTAQLIVSFAAPPEVSATAVQIVDRVTGTVIYEKRANERLPIASITKLFSSALFWANTDPMATTSVTWADVAFEGRSGRLKAGQTYQNRELQFPALLESSNDAAAVMQRSAPFDLIAAMNDFARQHDAPQTSFADASGLSDQNVSTARELGVLFRTLYAEEPHIIDITTLPNYLNHVNAWMNNNPFVDEPAYAGGKHGYTEAANRTAVALFNEPIGTSGRQIVYVLLGSDDLSTDMKILRDFTASAVRLQ